MTENNQELLPNLLIVDDDEVFCHVLSKAMKKRQYKVSVAYNLDQAKEQAALEHPEFAIVDLRIGQESGLQVIESLVESEHGIRIVVLTGFASIATAVEAIKLGATHYLTKPADIDEILQSFQLDKGDVKTDLNTHPMSVKRLEWEHLQKVLVDHDGNISAAARAMGMHRRTLQRKLGKKPVAQ